MHIDLEKNQERRQAVEFGQHRSVGLGLGIEKRSQRIAHLHAQNLPGQQRRLHHEIRRQSEQQPD